MSARPAATRTSRRGHVEASLRRSGLPFTVGRPSFISGPDRDESRPIERIGAAVGDATLGLPGASHLRDRYRSTSNSILATALVRLASDPRAENSVIEPAGPRD